MRDYDGLPGYDAWFSREPEYAEEPLPEEDELPPEPTVEEVWDGSRGEYVTQVTMANGRFYDIRQAKSGAYVGDFEIVGPLGFYAEGYSSVEKALDYLLDLERNR